MQTLETPGAGAKAPPIVVAGFGRCGSSLVMRMLHAGGIEPFCDPGNIGISYELDRWAAMVSKGSVPDFLREEAAGRSVKLLDIQRAKLPADLDFQVIWIDRAPRQQARSMANFLRWCGSEFVDTSRRQRRLVEAGYRADRAEVMRMIAPRRLLVLNFETLITHPRHVAATMATFAGIPMAAVARMESQVIKRSPKWSGSNQIEEKMRILADMDQRPVWSLRESCRPTDLPKQEEISSHDDD